MSFPRYHWSVCLYIVTMVIHDNNNLRLATWNVNGLGKPVKRNKVLFSLKSVRYDIVFLQECHLSVRDSKKLCKGWVGSVFCNSGTSQSRGVITLINKQLQFKCLKEVKDEEGRMLIIRAEVQGKTLILANTYAPNADVPSFYATLECRLSDMGSHPIIWAGDMNMVMDAVLDRSAPSKSKPPKSLLTLKKLCTVLGLVDVWRLFNPSGRDYTFFSAAHGVFTRIDCFFISKEILPSTLSCTIGSILISDHARVTLDLIPIDRVQKSSRWRLNSSLLQDDTFKAMLKTQIDLFMETNIASAPSAATAWEALKAFVRGHVIQFSCRKKRDNLRRLADLERKVEEAERRLKQDFVPHNLRVVTQLKYEYNHILSQKVEFGLFRVRQKYFESGDKAGRLLARYIKQQESMATITAVQSQGGVLMTKSADINDTFRKFYMELYTSTSSGTEDEILSFLKGLDLPTLSEEQRETLDGPIMAEEIIKVISNLQCGKAPGPDGLTAEFFKCFSEELTPLLLQMYNEAFERGTLPLTLTQALISLILKKDKDPIECKNYRPISLISLDTKILTKILANRLSKVIATLVHPDQVGFIQNRFSSDNIRRLVNVMWAVRNDSEPAAAISLDAEKAFDCVEWRYLFLMLETLGFGQTFIKWVKLLYNAPQSAVQTNGIISSYFKLGRGTQQGSPLSPLLFCLAIEPLAAAIRKDPNITGITLGGTQHKLMLYADDILILVTDPAKSIPAILEIIRLFSGFSGYRVNWTKSEALPLTSFCPKSLFQAGSFQWPQKGIKYLGIIFPRYLKDIVKCNFDPLLDKISRDMERWSPLYLSLWGKVNIIKMNSAPKLNYLLQSLPLSIPIKYFKQFDKLCNKFFWNGKRPRIHISKLQKPVVKGGLGLPNLLFYYYAFSLRHLSHWALPPERAPPWYTIEQSICTSVPPLLFLSARLPSDALTHPVVSHIQVIWKKVSRIFQIDPYLSLSSGIWVNPKLLIGRSPVIWREWVSKGIHTLGDLYEEGVLKPFRKLVEQFNLTNNQSWRYYQLRHLLVSTFGSIHTPPRGMDLIKEIVRIAETGHGASLYYSMLINKSGHKSNAVLKTLWEKDLGITYEEEEWDKITGITKQVSRDIRIKLIQFKILHRFYWYPSRLFRLGLKETPDCWRCVGEGGDLIHALWSCPKVHNFWIRVHEYITEVVGIDYEFCPGIYILGSPQPIDHIGKPLAHWIQTSIMIGKQMIMRKWKAAEGPLFQDWVSELGRVAAFERISYSVINKVEKYNDKWGKFLWFLSKPIT